MKGYREIAACAVAFAAADQAAEADPADLGHAEAVLRARVALADCLIAAGWQPPADAEQILVMDRGLLAQVRGTVEAEDFEEWLARSRDGAAGPAGNAP